MTIKPPPVTEADLHGYIDNQLSRERQIVIEAYLQNHPEELPRLQAYRAQNTALQAQFDPILQEAFPEHLDKYCSLLQQKQRSNLIQNHFKSWDWQRLAAGLAIAVLSGTSGWFLNETTSNHFAKADRMIMPNNAPSFPHQAAIAHVVYSPDIRRPVEIGSDQEEQLVAWLSKRLGSPIRPPILKQLDYQLIGGRLLPGAKGPVAQFMYHDHTGQRLTLYISTEQNSQTETGFKFTQEGPVSVFYWIDGKFSYALSGGMSKEKLTELANVVYQQFEKAGPPDNKKFRT